VLEKKTYGEAYVAYKESMNLSKGGELVGVKPPHLPRMKYREASIYYKKKINEYWKSQRKYELKLA